MGPSELEEYLFEDPVPTLRLILASGDEVIVRNEDAPFISGLSLVLRGDPISERVTTGSRLVSIPNIVLLEPVPPGRTTGRRRRR